MPFVTKNLLTEGKSYRYRRYIFIWNRNDWKEIFRQKGNAKNRICGSC